MKINTVILEHDPWRIECLPEDGARIHRLQYNGRDLLTLPPNPFKPPTRDYGAYETRPVYGYDDCWPTVEVCNHPATGWAVPDHGELCYLPWDVTSTNESLRCEVQSRAMPIRFIRTLLPADASLTWKFQAINDSNKPVAMQHIMHPLMPLDVVEFIALPLFESAWDQRAKADLPGVTFPGQVIDYLLMRQPRTATMLMLRGVKENAFALRFRGGPDLRVCFPMEHFDTLGIWWNRDAHPDEDGCRRNECAIEPISGPTSNLSEAMKHNRAITVAPASSMSWTVTWNILAPLNDSSF